MFIDTHILSWQEFHNSTIANLAQNLVWNFDMGVAAWNCPIWCKKSWKIWYGQNWVQSFYFRMQNFYFPVQTLWRVCVKCHCSFFKCKICIFWARKFHIWAEILDFQSPELPFFSSAEFPSLGHRISIFLSTEFFFFLFFLGGGGGSNSVQIITKFFEIKKR